jgi:hypothetical protein
VAHPCHFFRIEKITRSVFLRSRKTSDGFFRDENDFFILAKLREPFFSGQAFNFLVFHSTTSDFFGCEFDDSRFFQVKVLAPVKKVATRDLIFGFFSDDLGFFLTQVSRPRFF